MPKFASIIDQNRAIGFLSILLQADQIPHGLLFLGPKGVGKSNAAVALAMAANCQTPEKLPSAGEPTGEREGSGARHVVEPCGRCPSCKKIDSGNHPDILFVRPQGTLIKIGQIRRLRQTVTMRPHEARVRFVIIQDAHFMNPEASNALLKVLEEPPERTNLILTAMRTSDLLPTIVSRCQHIRFHPVSQKRLAQVLIQRHSLPVDKARVLATLAYGSYLRAEELMESDWLQRRNWLIEQARDVEKKPAVVLLGLAEELAQNKDSIQDSLEVIKTWFRDLIVIDCCPDRIINKDYEQALLSASGKINRKTILNRISAMARAQRDMDTNANPRLILENLFLSMADSN